MISEKLNLLLGMVFNFVLILGTLDILVVAQNLSNLTTATGTEGGKL